MEARRAALRWLESCRVDGGVWPYQPGGPPRLEPTLHVIAAGLRPDLGWLEESPWGWEALLVPAALSRLAGVDALRARGVKEILARRSETYLESNPGDLDSRIPGWSWYPDSFGWVEPTAYAVLSLRTMGMGDHERASQGIALLEDRQHVDGGWNYGNPSVMGTVLESYLPTTAWAAMALPLGLPVERALLRLMDCVVRPSTLTVSLAILARSLHRAPLGELPEVLVSLQETDGAFGGRCDWTALAAAALEAAEGGSHVFHLPS